METASAKTTQDQVRVSEFDAQSLLFGKLRSIAPKTCQKVLFITPAIFPLDKINLRIARNRRYYAYPPYGAGLLSAALKKKGFIPTILDLNLELLRFIHQEEREISTAELTALWKEKLEQTLEQFQPDLVGISCMFTMSHPMILDISNTIKHHYPQLPVLAGGVHITNAPENVLRESGNIDFVSLYEGDQSFVDLIEIINGTLPAERLSQLGSLIEGKYVCLEREIPSDECIDLIPDFLGLPLDIYSSLGEIGTFRYWRPARSKGSAMITNRGCRGRCSFCSVHNFNGSKVRSRSIMAVADEMQNLVENHGITHITWLDDDLFFNKQRTLDLLNEIIKRKLGITWDASNGIIASTPVACPEIIDAAAESGCIGVYVGIESGNPEILRKVRKPASVNQFLKLGALMKKHPQIFTRGFLIVGFPGETLGQMRDTVELANAMGLDWYTVQLLTPLPSTEIYTEMVDAGMIEKGSLNTSGDGYTMFSIRESERQRLKEMKEVQTVEDFSNFLRNHETVVPSKKELDDLWFLMDYKCNYERLLHETETMRLKKMQAFLSDVSYRMTIDNPLSTLFLGLVENKLGNPAKGTQLLADSKRFLAESKYWQARFAELSIHELYNNNFS